MSNQQLIEIFHLIFLRHLGGKIQKEHYALKRGCNLRFYFKSIRYSEDMDFDIKTVARNTLQSNIRKILKSPSLTKTLSAKGLEIIDSSEPKQTDTTQRWKISLRTKENRLPIPTKLEFSRRKMTSNVLFEAVDPELVQDYGLYPIYSNHYGIQDALDQKISALIHRTEIQARDVFDIDLIHLSQRKLKTKSNLTKEDLTRGQENALTLRFHDFKGQVVAYLLPEFQIHYDQRRWNTILENVVDLLESMKS